MPNFASELIFVPMMNKSRFFLLLLLVLVVPSFSSLSAQLPYQKLVDGHSQGGVRAVNTPDGGFMVVGLADTTGTQGSDIYLARFDAQGQLLWHKIYGGPGEEVSARITATHDGGYLIVGGTESFGADQDQLLMKVDSTGTILWHKVIHVFMDDALGTVFVTADNGFLLVGNVNGFQDYLAIRLDAAGNILWTHTYDALQTSWAVGVTEADNGDFLMTGPSFTGGSLSAINVLRIDSTGTVLWSKIYDGPGNEGGRKILKLNNNSYIITGYSHSTTWSTTPLGGFLLKIDGSGNMVDFKSYDTPGQDVPFGIVRKGANEIIVAGSVDSAAFGDYDLWMMSLDTNLNLNWSRVYGSSGSDRYQSVRLTPDGIGLTGFTVGFGSNTGAMYFVQTDSIGQSGCNETTLPVTVASPTPDTGSTTFIRVVRTPNVSSPTLTDTVLPLREAILCQTCTVAADYAPQNASFCLGDSVPFTNASTDATTYEWWVDGNLHSTQSSYTFSPAASGIYSVSLVAIDGSCQDTLTSTVTVDTLPDVLISGLPVEICENEPTFMLTGLPSGGVFSGSGMSGSTFDPAMAGIGMSSVIYTYTDGNSCTASDTQSIDVNRIPAAGFLFSTNSLTATFIDTTSTAISREWNFGDGSAVDTVVNTDHTYSQPGTYEVCLIVSNIDNCQDTVCDSVTVLETRRTADFASGTLHAYPNPARDQITLSFSGYAGKEVEIGLFDLLGREERALGRSVIRGSEAQMQLDLVGLAKGVYQLQVVEVESGARWGIKVVFW